MKVEYVQPDPDFVANLLYENRNLRKFLNLRKIGISQKGVVKIK